MPRSAMTDDSVARAMVDATASAALTCRTAAAIASDALAFDSAQQQGEAGIAASMDAMRDALRNFGVYHYHASPLHADHDLTAYAVSMASVLLDRPGRAPTTADDARRLLPELHRLLIGRAQRWRAPR